MKPETGEIGNVVSGLLQLANRARFVCLFLIYGFISNIYNRFCLSSGQSGYQVFGFSSAFPPTGAIRCNVWFIFTLSTK